MDQMDVQGGPSGRGIQFVDIKLKVPPQYQLIIQSGAAYIGREVLKVRIWKVPPAGGPLL